MATNPNFPDTAVETPTMPEHLTPEVASALRAAHERFGIPLNVGEKVYHTLATNGFTPLQPPKTPSVEEWIAERMVDQGYAGYNHGSFVVGPDGEIGFAKVHYGPDNTITITGDDGEPQTTVVGGPKREAAVLEALGSSGYEAPRVLGYSPESPEEASSAEAEAYEVLVIEAILPEDGTVRKREAWTPQLAKIAAQKISTFAKPIDEVPHFKDETIPLPLASLIEKLPQTQDDYDQAVGDVITTYPHLDSPIVVHGDTWFNNIIARHDDSDLMFVDWELAGPGYQGQDAGRKLWDLTLKDDWRFADYSPAAQGFTEQWCQTDEDRQSLAFGIVYESLRWISDRVDKIADPDTDEASRVSLAQEIDDVKSHTLMILSNLTRE